MKRRLIIAVLIVTMILSLTTMTQAVGEGKYIDEAEQLKLLGVFQGTDTGFELDRQPTRLEGLIMLIRLLGKETQAKALASQECVFTDVPDWGKGYANYAYEYGLTKGIGNNLFGTGDMMNAQSYTTFMLRALGYNDSNGDFTYTQAIDYAYEIRMFTSEDVAEITDNTFLRDHVAKVSMIALGTKIKTNEITLLEKLVNDGAISKAVADQIKINVNLMVHFIDVGQADAILVKKGDQAMLIDGGNNADSDLVVNYLKAQNVSALKYVIATHSHEDHIGGLDRVIQTFAVDKVIMPNTVSTTKTFEDLLLAISAKGLKVTKPIYGASYEFNGATFTILAPNNDTYTETNNYSIVIKLTNGSNSFLFTGDAESLSESEILVKNSQILKSDVLKIGHHGSSSSTSQAFLNEVDPTYAVISVGKDNDYGHPDQVVLDRLASKNINLFRTDVQGNIIASSNGQTIEFNTQPVVSLPPVPPTTTDTISDNVIISNVDKVGEVVTIKNTGSVDIDITGWTLVSVTGNQRYVFPQYILKANSSVKVASAGAEGDLIWTIGNVWNNSSSDPAELYDGAGNKIFEYER